MPKETPHTQATSSFLTLRSQLERLHKHYGLCALKSGTEVEDMSFEEIAFLKNLSTGIVPLYVKISGPEARNDVRELMHLGVDGLIAPMIESPYALQKFIETLKTLLSPDTYKKLVKGINIETITALQKLDDILALPETREINQITAARSDLSASMEMEMGNELSASDPQVITNCRHIMQRAKEYDIAISVGGQLTPSVAPHLIEEIQPKFLNSRHMVLDVQGFQEKQANPTEEAPPIVLAVMENLQFENRLYQLMGEHFALKSEHYEKRIAVLEERLQNHNVPSLLKNKVGVVV